MKYYTYSLKSVLTLAAVIVTIGAGGISLSAYAAPEKKPDQIGKPEKAKPEKAKPEKKEKRVKILKENDKRLKVEDPVYSEQVKSLAAQYIETAEIIAQQGGNPQPLLDAAAHFEGEAAEIISGRDKFSKPRHDSAKGAPPIR